jgi:hypothetical protein
VALSSEALLTSSLSQEALGQSSASCMFAWLDGSGMAALPAFDNKLATPLRLSDGAEVLAAGAELFEDTERFLLTFDAK